MTDKKKKKGVAVIISIGPKMPKKPMDAATPDMKKYGSMPMKKTWQTLKALPQHQMFQPAYERANLAEDTYEGEGVDVGERQEGAGTIHPAIYAMMQRRMKENPHLTSGSYNDENADLPNLNLRANESALDYRDGKTPTLDMHPEYYADSMPYGSVDDPNDQFNAYANKDNQRRTKAPQSYSYQQTHPTNKEVRDFKDEYAPFMQEALKNTELGRRAAREGKPMQKAFQMLKQNFRISNLPEHVRERNLPDMSPQRFIDEDLHRKGAKNYTRDFMPGPSRYDDEGFEEYDMRDMGPPYGKPEFGNEDARQAEMNQAERAAIMAEGMPEMRKPRGAPRPGDPRFADPNKPRPRVPKDVFANR
jgi:hypothetical protein